MSKQERRRVRVAVSIGLTVLMSSAILGGMAPLTTNAAEVESEPTTTEVSSLITVPEDPSDAVVSLPEGNALQVADETPMPNTEEDENTTNVVPVPAPELDEENQESAGQTAIEGSFVDESEVSDPKATAAAAEDENRTIEDNWGSVHWTFEDGVLTLSGGVGSSTDGDGPWREIAPYVNKVLVTDQITAPEDVSALFANFSFVTEFEGMDKIDTSNVIEMTGMFAGTRFLTSIDLTSWDVALVQNVSSLFYRSGIVSLDLSSWSPNNLQLTYQMFDAMPNLEYLDISSLSFSQNVSILNNLTQLRTLVLGSNTLLYYVPTPQGATWVGKNTGHSFSEQYDGGHPDTYHLNYELVTGTWGTVDWRIDDDILYLFSGEGENTTSGIPWADHAWRIEKVVLEGNVVAPENPAGLFANLRRVTEYVGLELLDISQTEILTSMFAGNLALKTLRIGSWDVSHIKNMPAMFEGCTSLNQIDIENWNVENVESMSALFLNTGFESLDLSKWHFSGSYIGTAFQNMPNLKTLDISNFDLTGAYTGSMLRHTPKLIELTLGDNSQLGPNSLELTDKVWQGDSTGHQFSFVYGGGYADTYRLVDGTVVHHTITFLDSQTGDEIGEEILYGQPGEIVPLSRVTLPAGYELPDADATIQLPEAEKIWTGEELELNRVVTTTTRTIQFQGLPEGHLKDEVQEVKWHWDWTEEDIDPLSRNLRFYDGVVYTAQGGYDELPVPEVEGYEADIAVVAAKSFDTALSDVPEDETVTVTYTKVDSEDGGDQNPDPTPSQPDPDNGSGSGGSNGNGNTGNGSTGTGSTGTGSVGGGQLTNLSTGGSTTTDQNQALPQTGSQVASGLTLLGLGLLGLLGFTKRRKRE